MEKTNFAGYNNFIQNITSYYSRFENTKNKISLFKNAYQKIIEQELPEREHQKLFVIRDFTNSTGLNINLSLKNLYCKEDDQKNLIVGTLSPNWIRGWRNISKDKFVSEQIDSFFFLTTQYITRSFQINLIAAIALVYNRTCDFKGHSIQQIQLPFLNREYIEFTKSIPTKETLRTQKLKHYLNIINSLDPWVNKANCYYVRAIDLRDHGYFEESITNLDNTVDTITQYLKLKKRIPTLSRNLMLEELSKEMGITTRVCDYLERLYLLRCRFSSHPAQSKWWDFSEIYDDNIDKMFEYVGYILVKFFQYETINRYIDDDPPNWANWSYKYADILFDAVWFHKIP